MIEDANVPRIRELIKSLNNLALQRQALADKLWLLESEGQDFRLELMKLLDTP